MTTVTEITLPDGRTFNAATGKQVKHVQIPSNTEAQKIVANTRRKLVDLPDTPQRMNAISAVVAYTLFGLSEDEISVALSVPVERIHAIKMLDAFVDMTDAVMEGVKAQDLDPVQGIIHKHAQNAATQIAMLATQADDEKVQLGAAKDILDRAGHRPADVKELRVSMENTMLIEHVTRSEHDDAENINIIDAEVIEDGSSS